MHINLTLDMVRAAAADAGNRRMRIEGRRRWNRADFEYAAAEFNRIARAAGLIEEKTS